MAEIAAGDEISAKWWPDSVRVAEGTDQLDITSTSFIAGSPECSTTFVAALSGRAQVVVSGELRNDDTAGERVFLSFEVRLGSSAGAVFMAASAFRSASTSGDTTASGDMIHGNVFMLDGLTPEETYFIRTMQSVTGGTTNDIKYRRVCVVPVP